MLCMVEFILSARSSTTVIQLVVAFLVKYLYKRNYTEEVFIVAARLHTHPARYRLKDFEGELILGSYYAEDLQKAPEEGPAKVEKVVRRKAAKGVKQALVKWKYYAQKHNSWIPESDLHLYK